MNAERGTLEDGWRDAEANRDASPAEASEVWQESGRATDQGADRVELRGLVVDQFDFHLARPISPDLAERAARIFALARVGAERIIDGLISANAELRAALSGGTVELAEVVAPARLLLDDRPDEALAAELAAFVVGQVIEQGVSAVARLSEGT